jgi:hypothetical protein
MVKSIPGYRRGRQDKRGADPVVECGMRSALLVILLGTPVSLFAKGREPVAVQEPFATETSSTFTFRSFEDDQGGFYIVWPHEENGQTSLLGQHVDNDGRMRWTTPGASLVDGIADGSRWDAVPDSKGGLVLAWEAADQIRAQRIDGAAKLIWPGKYRSVTRSTATQASPTLSPDGSGGAYFVWQEQAVVNRMVLIGQHLDAGAKPLWGKSGTRVSLRPSDQRLAKTVYDGAAGIVVAWHDSREQASQLQAQRLNYQGNRLWGLEGLVVTAPSAARQPPYLEPVGHGSAVLAWQGSSSATDRIFLQLISGAGKLMWDAAGREVDIGRWHHWNPVLHGDGEEGVWVGWEDYRNNSRWSAFVKHQAARAAIVDAESVNRGQEILLADVNADQGRLSMTSDGAGGVFAAWIDNRLGTTGVYLQRISEKGETLLGREGVTVANQLVDPRPPQITAITPGQAAICWADSPKKGQWALFWQRIGTAQAHR